MTRREVLREEVHRLKKDFGITSNDYNLDSIANCRKAISELINIQIKKAVKIEKMATDEMKQKYCDLMEQNQRVRDEYNDLLMILNYQQKRSFLSKLCFWR